MNERDYSNLSKVKTRVGSLGYTVCNMVIDHGVGPGVNGVVLGFKRIQEGPLQGTKRFSLWTFSGDGSIYWGHYDMGEGEAHALFVQKARGECRAKSSKIGEPIPA